MGYFKKLAMEQEKADIVDSFTNMEELSPVKAESMNVMFQDHQFNLLMEQLGYSK